eukprot:169287-Prorocentrum_minimum.AAC.2
MWSTNRRRRRLPPSPHGPYNPSVYSSNRGAVARCGVPTFVSVSVKAKVSIGQPADEALVLTSRACVPTSQSPSGSRSSRQALRPHPKHPRSRRPFVGRNLSGERTAAHPE